MKIKTTAIAAALAALAMLAAGAAFGQDEGATPHYPLKQPRHKQWTFSGPFGTYDPQQLQRGFQVYREVCSACHSMNLVAFRNLAEEGGPQFGEEEVKALAAEYQITDGPDDFGDMFDRPGIPADRLPAPFANSKAAAAANGGAVPPDFSLIAKARAVERGFPLFLLDMVTQYQEGGPDYIYSLLTGYEEPPAGLEVRQGLYYNPYFMGANALAMAPPLSDGVVTYSQNADELPSKPVPETVDQYAQDVAAFLMWASEPEMAARKRIGLNVMVFLIVLAGLVYYTKKKVWADTPAH